MELDGPHQKGGQGEAVARVEAEVEAVGVVPLTLLSLTEVEVVVEGLKVLRREGLEVEEGTFCLVVVGGHPLLAWKVVVEVQLWELLKVVGEEHLFPWQGEEGGLSCVEGEEGAVALLLMVVEVVVLAFAVHF